MKSFLKTSLAIVVAFLGPVSGSIRGFLNTAEISRAFTSAVGASGAVGFLAAFLSTIGSDASNANKATASFGLALVAFIAVQTADLLRRLGQGPLAPAPQHEPSPEGRLAPKFTLLSHSEPDTIDRAFYRSHELISPPPK